MVLHGKSLQKAWETLDFQDCGSGPNLRCFRRVLGQLRMMADKGEEKVMAWVSHVAPSFDPDVDEREVDPDVDERETVSEQTQKK